MKTLRRELKPVWKTLEYIKKDQWVLDTDTTRDQGYMQIKPILDALHNDFIKQSLEKTSIDVSDFFVFYTDYKKKLINKKSLTDKELESLQKEFDQRKKELRQAIGNVYIYTAEERKNIYTDEKGKDLLKASWYKILTESGIQKVLEQRYQHDVQALEIIKSFAWFWTYFTGFNQNRENYYTVEGKVTEIAFRIIDQNLITFCNNILLYDKINDIWLTQEEQEIFDPQSYIHFLTQEGIDRYNYTIGGTIDEHGKRITDGINQRINQHNQQHKTKLPQLTTLYKQIWSDKGKTKLFESIESDGWLEQTIAEYMALCDQQVPKIQKTITDFFGGMEQLDKVWISKVHLTWLSNKFFANWYMVSEQWQALGVFSKKKDSNKERQVKVPDYVSLADLKSILENVVIPDQTGVEEDKKITLFKKELEKNKTTNVNNREYFVSLLKNHYETILDNDDDENLWLRQTQEQVKRIDAFDTQNQHHKNTVKVFGDKTIELLRFLKLWRVDVSKWQQETSDFTKEIDLLIQDFDVNRYYDLIRNYVTKKPFSIEKMKLNFDCSTLLWGWDKNKETQNLSVILKDNEWYYLAIMKKENNQFFDQRNKKLYAVSSEFEDIHKMEYKQIALPTWVWWFVRKCFNSAQAYWRTCPVECLNSENKIIIKNDEVSDLPVLIQCYKDFFNKYEKDWFKYKDFNFQFKENTDYVRLSDFFSDVERQWYKLSRTPINKQELDTAVEKGQVYLFRLSSKDFGKWQTDKKPNLQTLYRLDMFRPWSNIKLNGGAEVFFRPASLKDKKRKKTKHWESINDNAIEKKRYTEDKILFHCPITLNFASKKVTKVNDEINEYIKNNQCNIIGIDRGEKHLNFYSVINPQGDIIEQGTLNIFEYEYTDKEWKLQKKSVDYGQLLEENAQNRLSARQNREIIGKIKELKEWYISHVVKKIADLVLKYNALVVLENLNTGFKNSRKKIEKSAYQNLEVALAKKLSFLVDKSKNTWELWSVTNPYQLCPFAGTFGDIERATQRWIILYTRANYTSTTDPITWWRKTIYLKKWSVDEMKKNIQESFVSIGFDTSKQAYYLQDKKRRLRSNVERRRWAKNAHWKWIEKQYNPTEELDKRCTKYAITKNSDILSQLHSQESVWCFQTLIWIIDLIMQIRNSDAEKNDFIVSCVEDKNGNKFDSREYYKLTDQEKANNISKPTSWDANWAYNIARKWIIMVWKIKKWEKSLFVSDSEWDLSLNP